MTIGWDKKPPKNSQRKDFKNLRRQIQVIERSRPEGKLSYIGVVLIRNRKANTKMVQIFLEKIKK